MTVQDFKNDSGNLWLMVKSNPWVTVFWLVVAVAVVGSTIRALLHKAHVPTVGPVIGGK